MKNLTKNIWDFNGIALYIIISIINFFWYMLIGEDTELNTGLTYIYYLVFYFSFSSLLIVFLTFSKTKVSKIIVAFLGFITIPLWIAGYRGAAGMIVSVSGLVNARLVVLIIHSLTTLYALLRLFTKNRGGQCHIT